MDFRYVAIIDGKAYLKEGFEREFQREFQRELDIMKEERGMVLVGEAFEELYEDMKFDWYIKDDHPDKPSGFPEWEYLVFEAGDETC